MLVINPKETPTKDLHQFLLASVSPRPIAFASTIDEDGNPNLAPYSFFNAFSSNPPIVVFSSNRRVSNNTTKDTLHNIMRTKEVVINVVNYNIVRQMAVASIEYPSDVSEFTKSGLTPIPADLIKPYRVKESPVQMECKVKEIITLGEAGGAGHLIICDVLRMHIDENIVDENNRINPHKIDLVGRLGRAYYTRVKGESIFTVAQSVLKIGIGFDKLPTSIQNSKVLTGNNLGQLAGLEQLPTKAETEALQSDEAIQKIFTTYKADLVSLEQQIHLYAQEQLKHNNVDQAARVLMLLEYKKS